MLNKNDYSDITQKLREISEEASKKILEIYNSDFKINYKSDSSPLTLADTESNKIICNKLRKEFKKIPIISEENKVRNLSSETFFLVDPLDGTKEFIARNGEFTVNIGLVINNKPKLGVIQIPVKSTQYFSDGVYSYKFKKTLKKISSLRNNKKFRVTISRSHLDLQTKEFIQNNKDISIFKAGSSLKFCLIAEGKADFYIRNGKTMGWDIAAGIAILKTAGGNIRKLNLKELIINKKTFINDPFICFRNNFDSDKLNSILKQF